MLNTIKLKRLNNRGGNSSLYHYANYIQLHFKSQNLNLILKALYKTEKINEWILMNEALTFFFIINVIYNDAVMQVSYFHKAY
jgi:hypothetical protein